MNPEKKEKLDLSDIPVIDLTMDDSDESEELLQSNNAEVTKRAFPKKQKGGSPASKGFRAESRLSTCHQEIARLGDRAGVRSSISELQDAESSCLASVLKSEFKKNIWILKTDAWRMSTKNVAEVTSMPGDPWNSQQPRGTCANDETLGTIVGRICDATTDISIKECPENLHGGRSEGKPSQTFSQETSTSSSSLLRSKNVLSTDADPSIILPASSSKSKTVSKSTKEGDLFMPKVVRKRVGEKSEIGRPKKMAKEDQEVRRSVSMAVLSETLWNRCKETVDLKTDKAAIRNIAIQVEESLFLVSGEVDDDYMDKYNEIVKNLKDTKKFLFRQIATQKITSNDLANMTPEELADADMAAWQETKLRLMLNAARKGKVSLKNLSEADGIKIDKRLKALKKPDKECDEGAKALPIATVSFLPLDSNQDTTPVHRLNSDATLLTVDLKKNQFENYRNQGTTSSYFAKKEIFDKPRYHHPSVSKDQHQTHSERVEIMKKPDSNDQSTSLLSAREKVLQSVSDHWMIEKVNALRVTDHVAHSEIAEPRRVEMINTGRKPFEKQFCKAKLNFVEPASLLKKINQTSDAEKNSKTRWSAEAAFREAMIPYLGPPSRLNHSSLDIKTHTSVVGESSSYPRLVRITGITNRTSPADPRLRASTPSFEMKPSKVTNIPLLNEDSSSINMQEFPKKIWRSWN